MADLVLGPLLRYVGRCCATVWVETDAACEVRVLDCTARTFAVAGHHYALVVVTGLPERGDTPYDVALDGRTVWPDPADGWPASRIRTRGPADAVRLAFGSCRVAGPLDDATAGVDALHALAERMRGTSPKHWPDELLLVGDQVYADENISPQTAVFIASRRDTTVAPWTEVADVEEYTHLYRESGSVPPVRWLLSTLPSSMVFDDHDVRDDWNTSKTWRTQMHATGWWQGRIEAGLMTYWLYQHLGNLSPDALAGDPLLTALQSGEGDGAEVLRAFAQRADAQVDGVRGDGPRIRWSFRRDLGTARLLVLDSRCGRVLAPDRRDMFDEPEWAWFAEQLEGDYDHLLLASSLPFLLPPGLHHLEACDEAVAEGVWGGRAAQWGERLRQAADLEHWAAFGKAFARMTGHLAEVGARPDAPATVTFLSGDVHFAYLAEAHFPDRPEVTSRIYQAVCSPLRNPLPRAVGWGQRFASSRAAGQIGRVLSRAARVARPELSWRVTGGPSFGNEVATLVLDGRSARLSLEAAVPGPRLSPSFSKVLAAEGRIPG